MGRDAAKSVLKDTVVTPRLPPFSGSRSRGKRSVGDRGGAREKIVALQEELLSRLDAG